MPPQGGENGKRVAPISASAFSFSLRTPAKKPKPAPATPSSVPPARTAAAHSNHAGPSTVVPSSEPRAPISSLVLVTPTRLGPKAGALPSPFGLTGTSPRPPRPQKPLTSVLDDPASPFRHPKQKPVEERKDLQGITAMPRIDVGEIRQQRLEAEEGIGVSPRRHKGAIQHKGSGPPPSVRLANLVSSANTSLVLFYTSLQQTLYPSTRAVRSPHACLNHIRTAPIRLQVSHVVPGPTHSAVMVACDVLQWHSKPAPASVMVVFQALPADCPKLGLDPRLLPSSSADGKVFEVGVMPPWSESVMPSIDSAGDEVVLFASRYLVAERGDDVSP